MKKPAHHLAPDDAKSLLEEVLPPFYELIGRIASIWAALEHRIDQLIWDLMDVEQTLGACLTTQLNGPQVRIRCLKALLEARGWPQAKLTELNKFGSDMQVVQEERNRAVHDVMLVGTQSRRPFNRRVATIANKIVFETKQLSIEDLKMTVEESMALLERFGQFQTQVRTAVPIASDERLRKLLWREGPPDEVRLNLDSNLSARRRQLQSLAAKEIFPKRRRKNKTT
ncbi:hypothetical protein [Acidisoma silvae]|uniref:Uncharacterized protein n=1 Tax=Acidisoma silvae TaxID=2802396 RepID=A0A964E0R6_9PROT|nr:hypothetical protein [Acidisoma silvae]MCB8877591.1 hypothetical protein [Acidisoma silvae]